MFAHRSIPLLMSCSLSLPTSAAVHPHRIFTTRPFVTGPSATVRLDPWLYQGELLCPTNCNDKGTFLIIITVKSILENGIETWIRGFFRQTKVICYVITPKTGATHHYELLRYN